MVDRIAGQLEMDYEKNLTLDIAKWTQKYLNKHYTDHTIKLSRTNDKFLSLLEHLTWLTLGKLTFSCQFILMLVVTLVMRTSSTTNYLVPRLKDVMIFIQRFQKNNPFGVTVGRKANFAVLRLTKMSGILTENGFIDTRSDANKLKSNSYLDRIAKGHADGIAKVFNLKKKVKEVAKTRKRSCPNYEKS